MKLTTQFEGDAKLRKGVETTAKGMPGSIYEAVVRACSLVETRAKTHHLAGGTLNYRTHRLQRSVKSRVFRMGNATSGRVGSPVVYAAIFEHKDKQRRIIRPKNAKFLTFQINGKWIRTKKVTMPYKPWLTNSLKDVQPEIEKLFHRKIKIVIG